MRAGRSSGDPSFLFSTDPIEKLQLTIEQFGKSVRALARHECQPDCGLQLRLQFSCRSNGRDDVFQAPARGTNCLTFCDV